MISFPFSFSTYYRLSNLFPMNISVFNMSRYVSEEKDTHISGCIIILCHLSAILSEIYNFINSLFYNFKFILVLVTWGLKVLFPFPPKFSLDMNHICQIKYLWWITLNIYFYSLLFQFSYSVLWLLFEEMFCMNTKCGIALFLPFCGANTRELVAVSQRFLFLLQNKVTLLF